MLLQLACRLHAGDSCDTLQQACLHQEYHECALKVACVFGALGFKRQLLLYHHSLTGWQATPPAAYRWNAGRLWGAMACDVRCHCLLLKTAVVSTSSALTPCRILLPRCILACFILVLAAAAGASSCCCYMASLTRPHSALWFVYTLVRVPLHAPDNSGTKGLLPLCVLATLRGSTVLLLRSTEALLASSP